MRGVDSSTSAHFTNNMLSSMDAGQLASLAGSVAGMLSIGAFLPQAWRIYQRRSAADVSLLMYLSIIAGCVLWMFYAYVRGQVELLVTNMIIAAVALLIVGLKLRYGRA
jgi:MtN3 and saliva related transmembrane protein